MPVKHPAFKKNLKQQHGIKKENSCFDQFDFRIPTAKNKNRLAEKEKPTLKEEN